MLILFVSSFSIWLIISLASKRVSIIRWLAGSSLELLVVEFWFVEFEFRSEVELSWTGLFRLEFISTFVCCCCCCWWVNTKPEFDDEVDWMSSINFLNKIKFFNIRQNLILNYVGNLNKWKWRKNIYLFFFKFAQKRNILKFHLEQGVCFLNFFNKLLNIVVIYTKYRVPNNQNWTILTKKPIFS